MNFMTKILIVGLVCTIISVPVVTILFPEGEISDLSSMALSLGFIGAGISSIIFSLKKKEEKINS